jgi:hypothetical protein
MTEVAEKTKPVRKRRRIWLISLGTVFIVLIVARLFLPYIVLRFLNDELSNLTEYTGHVSDIDIALFRGAYVVKNIEILKKEHKEGKTDITPFFTCPNIDLSIEWRALFKGAVVGELYLDDPVMNFVKGKHKNEDVRADTADFRKLIKDLMPLTVNHFEIKNGQIHFIDKDNAPAIDLSMKEIEAVATNLSNANDSAKVLPAHCDAHGDAYEGKFNLRIDFDALNNMPTFDMKAELNDLNIVKLNDFFKKYGNFETKKGSISIYTEFAAKKGEFGGYVKPIIKDLKIQQGQGSIKEAIWEMIVGVSSKILKNPDAKQIATKVDIHGRFDDPNINIWRSVSFLLRNAFVQALKPSVDNTISINQLDEEQTQKKTLLEKVFNGTSKKKENGKSKHK